LDWLRSAIRVTSPSVGMVELPIISAVGGSGLQWEFRGIAR
jgi:hypothetical protein